MQKKMVVLASGRGTDFQAIAEHVRLRILQNVEISALVCNHPGAQVVERAKKFGVDVVEVEGVTGRKFSSKEEREAARAHFDSEILKFIMDNAINLVVLAGFDQIVSASLVDACPFRILNIHPAYDLKQFGGRNMVGAKVHELVLKSGAEYSGCTVHFVTKEVDLGPPILKKRVPVLPEDTPGALEARVLAMEHLAYPEAIQLVVDGRVLVQEGGARCYVDRLSDNWDMKWSQRQQAYKASNPETAVLAEQES